MSMSYVQGYYGVPAKRGGRIRVEGREGTILSATHHLHVRFNDGQMAYLHPTWEVEYLPSSPVPSPGAGGPVGGGQ